MRAAPLLAGLLLSLSVPTFGQNGVSLRLDIPYCSPDGEDLLLDAYLPKGEGPFPAVVVIHGGSWRSGTRRQLALHAWWFAREGLAAFAIDYRLAPRHVWPAQIHDCKAAVRWIRAHAAEYRVDPERIGAHGYSAGGHLAALLGAAGPGDGLEGVQEGEESDTRIQAVSVGAAPLDLRGSATFQEFLGGPPGAIPDVYRAASPVVHVSGDEPPFFFFNGSRDRVVRSNSLRAMIDPLRAAGIRAEFYEVEGTGHIATVLHPGAIERAATFLRENLATGSGR
ncbi:MAG: alpha/beta hydrolase [Planctomycetes bacterium]|nr:alpha/beta hydrolase [Planctomycetota bacterium]